MKTTKVRDYVVESLKYALNPRTIAVVGASRYPEKWVIRLSRIKRLEFQGPHCSGQPSR